MDYGTVIITLLKSTLITLQLFALTLVLSIPLGMLVTLIVKSKIKIFRWIGNVYIYILRGTPLLLQLFFIYFGMPFIPVIGPFLQVDSAFTCAVIAFVLNYAAYFAEIFRGGLLAIDKGQYEAAKVLGFTKVQTLVKIILPQVIRVTLPSICNEAVTLVKDTSLVFCIGVIELLTNTKQIVNSQADTTPYLFAAVIYLIMTTIITIVFRKIEKKYQFGEGE